MDRSHRNKENNPICKSKSINSFFRVQKRLFESNKLDYTSPISNSIRPSSPACEEDDSPYLYEIRKKQAALKFAAKGLAAHSHRAINETPLKRSSSSVKQRVCLSSSIMEISSDVIIDNSNDVVMESPKSSAVMKIVEKVMDTEEEDTLSGDFSQKCILPVIKGKHPELNTISAETVAWLLITDHDYDITIIDCRYPYEFSAGHIKNAINLYSKERVDKDFFNSDVTKEGAKSERLLIFYCEFSSERAPNMMRFIRKRDRSLNEDTYPFVYYPEMYLIDGGYKSFFASFKELCEPQNYKPMLDKENTKEFVYYKSLCKSSNFKLQKDEKR
ncbi:unnamed protein product [Larinioides sclopetarius]|uniref:protein-tyrosine-phosphatase n=1 Tax=Larinioides sclopetarius TaxID=280406 RepID=A0AAV2AHY4_9ARAC